MADIYVPLDYSDVGSVIPQGEEVIYSTLCKAIVDRGFGAVYTNITKWVTHVLITTKGLACSVPQKKKPNISIYMPWYDIFHVWNDGIFVGSLKEMLVMTRDPNFESKENFKERRLKAGKIFLPILIAEKEKFLNSPECSNLDKKKIKRLRSSLEHNYKLYHNLKKKGKL